MNIIDRAAMKAGIDLERDVPVPGQRRTKDWAKLIGTARKLEAEEAAQERASHRQIQELSQKVAQLVEEKAELQRKVDLFILKERARQIELPSKDVKLLLGEKDS